MRLRNIPRAAQELALSPETVIRAPFDFRGNWAKEIFENENPVHLELGIGRGNFIINSALKNPEINYVGIEKFDSVLLRALEKTKKVGVKNLRFIREDAANLLKIFADGEVEKIYLNFSDPWPRTADRKRRLTHGNFLQMYKKILGGGALVQLKTDNRRLFEFSLREFNNFGFHFNEINLDLHSPEPTCNIRTEYEERFALNAKTIYMAAVSVGGK